MIPVDLVEGLADRYAAPFQFHMHHRQPVDQNRHIIAVVICRAFRPAELILVDHLQAVVVDVPFVQQGDVQGRAVLSFQYLHGVVLDAGGLLFYPFILVGDALGEKSLPLPVRKTVVVQHLQLPPEVGRHLRLRAEAQVLVPLPLQHADELSLQLRLALVLLRPHARGLVGARNRVLARRSNNVEEGSHACFSGLKLNSLSR